MLTTTSHSFSFCLNTTQILFLNIHKYSPGIEILKDSDRKSHSDKKRQSKTNVMDDMYGNDAGNVVDDEEDFGIVAMDCGLLRWGITTTTSTNYQLQCYLQLRSIIRLLH